MADRKKKDRIIGYGRKKPDTEVKPEPKPELEKLEILQKPEQEQKEQIQTSEDKTTEHSLNMIYGGVAILAVLLILGVLLVININKTPISFKDNAPADSNLTTGIGYLDVTTGTLPALGSDTASVALIEFVDYQCQYCGAFHKDAGKKIRENYVNGGKVKYYSRDLPITSLHDKAKDMANAARCANEQGKFWEMHDMLFNKQGEWSILPKASALEKAAGYAKQLGLNESKFKACVESQKYASDVDADYNYFVSQFKSPSTPIVFAMIPKNKISDADALKSLSAKYDGAIVVGQNTNNYVVVFIGVLPFDAYKEVLDMVKY